MRARSIASFMPATAVLKFFFVVKSVRSTCGSVHDEKAQGVDREESEDTKITGPDVLFSIKCKQTSGN